jgi:SAM-dependent methyltransferase
VSFVEIDGVRCYSPELVGDYADYPVEGFDATAALEADSFWCRSRNRILRDVVNRFTDRSRRLSVLEVGCGIGGVVAELRRFPHLAITASEIYLHGLHYARQRFPDVQFIQLDATAMPFRAEFDIVGAFDVLEHIEADERALSGIHQALRPGGLLLVTVPQYQWMWSPLDEIVHHKRRYARRDLIARLQRGPFEVIYCSSFVTVLFPAMMLSRLLARRRPLPADPQAAFTSLVSLPPPVNRACDWLMRLDEMVLRTGASLPFGGSLLAVARKA